MRQAARQAVSHAAFQGIYDNEGSVLKALRQAGVALVEARISHLSSIKGQLLENICLPDKTRLACVVRDGRPILDLESVFLEENDALYLITDDETQTHRILAL
jgi:NhaP-type Na+/H+ and K+/H+ antiporter